MRTLLSYSSVIALLAALPAQGQTQAASPFRFVPSEAQLVLRVGAPAAWKEHFGKTKVAKVLGGEALAPMIAKLQQGFDEGLEEARAKGNVDVDLVKRFVAEYSGELVFAAHLDLATVKAAAESDGAPGFWFSMALVPDGKFDLAAFADMIVKSAEKDEKGLRDIVIGEHRFRGAEVEDGVTMTLPAMIDGQLVMLGGLDLPTRGLRVLAADGRMSAVGDGAPLSMNVELRGAMDMLLELAREQGENEFMPFDVAQLLRDVGFAAIESASTSLFANGDRVQWDATVGLAAENRGIFDLVPADPGAREMLRYLPPGVDSFSVSPFDASALLRLVTSVWTILGDQAPMSFEDAMAMFTETFKVRLKEDLIDHVGTGFMQLQDVASSLDVDAMEDAASDNPLGAAVNSCYAIRLRDGKAFGASLETLLRSRGLHTARKTEDYQGTPVHRLRLAGMIELDYAVTDDLLLLAAGSSEAPGQYLRGVLDAKKKDAPAELPKEVAAHVAALPAGWVGLSVSPIGEVISGLGDMMDTLQSTGEFGGDDEAEMAIEFLKTLGREFERAGLNLMVATTYVEARKFALRLLW